MRVRFLQSYTVQAAGGETYLEGQVYDLPDATARHFLRKRRAEICNEPVKIKQVPTVAELPPEIGEAVMKTEARTFGERGGDPVKKSTKAQSSYRKRALAKEGE